LEKGEGQEVIVPRYNTCLKLIADQQGTRREAAKWVTLGLDVHLERVKHSGKRGKAGRGYLGLGGDIASMITLRRSIGIQTGYSRMGNVHRGSRGQ